MSTTAEKIAVMQAYERGENIQVAVSGSDEWDDWIIVGSPSWSWRDRDYRVKPKPLDLWLVLDHHGVVVAQRKTKAEANNLGIGLTSRLVHMREVTP